MAGGGYGDGLTNTPTWSIASSCAIFIVVSLLAERSIHLISHLLVKFKKVSLHAAFEKVKQELMMVGFISIALALGQDTFSYICVPTKSTAVMLLCSNSTKVQERLGPQPPTTTDTCAQDHSLYMPAEELHQLHILIFFLTIVHIVYTLVTVAVGMWTVHYWKNWEERAQRKEELSTQGGVRLTKDTTFMRAHKVDRWMSHRVLSYVVSFFQQFHNFVSETDYLTLRYGFIKNHMPGNSEFNFHRYIQRSLQDDFKHVVGISPGLWAYTVVWLLLNINGWASSIYVTLIPLILVLIIGTKLRHIITKMALRFNSQHALTIGMPNVTPTDQLFWFNRPRFILLCIHFILFENALDVAFDIWAAIKLPSDNCVHQRPALLIVRIVIGILVQVLLGLITLPIYALVSQMGSHVKRAIFEEPVQMALMGWRNQARSRLREAREHGEGSGSGRLSASSDDEDDAYTMEMVFHNHPNL